MRIIIVFVLAVIVGGCAAGQWRVISPPCAKGHTAWIGPERCGDHGARRMVSVTHPVDHPDRLLYVIDSTSYFYSPGGYSLDLRPARPTDTTRYYAWRELPNVFEPCP